MHAGTGEPGAVAARGTSCQPSLLGRGVNARWRSGHQGGVLSEPHAQRVFWDLLLTRLMKLWGFLYWFLHQGFFSFFLSLPPPCAKPLVAALFAVILLLPLVRRQMFCICRPNSRGHLGYLHCLKESQGLPEPPHKPLFLSLLQFLSSLCPCFRPFIGKIQLAVCAALGLGRMSEGI